jgi:hypothetical protein
MFFFKNVLCTYFIKVGKENRVYNSTTCTKAQPRDYTRYSPDKCDLSSTLALHQHSNSARMLATSYGGCLHTP